MANWLVRKGRVLGLSATTWVLIFVIFVPCSLCGAAFGTLLLPQDLAFIKYVLWGIAIVGFPVTFGATLLGVVRVVLRDERQRVEKERERQLQIIPPPPPPDPYEQAEDQLRARKERALELQRLHKIRLEVEEEERKAGVFAPTLSPTQLAANSQSASAAPKAEAGLIVSPEGSPPSDPIVAEMHRLALRRQEAERQKHLTHSRRMVEEAEREADGL